MLEGGAKVLGSQGSNIPGSQGCKVEYGHLKVTFEYEFDSREAPSCFFLFKCRDFQNCGGKQGNPNFNDLLYYDYIW